MANPSDVAWSADPNGRIKSALAELVDKDAIRDLVLAYCQAIDRKDFAKLRELYLPDALDEHGCNPTNTAAEFIDTAPSRMARAITCQHNVTNHYIKIAGDVAEGEACAIVYHLTGADSGNREILVLGARYLDRYSRCADGRWRFAHRKLVRDWAHRAVLAPQAEAAEEVAGMASGLCSAEDPRYNFFSLFKRGER